MAAYGGAIRRPTPYLIALSLGLSLSTAAAPVASAAPDPAAREASCTALLGGTVGDRDVVPFTQIPEAGSLAQWPAAPAGLLPARVHLRGAHETFNGRYAFATRAGALYVAPAAGGAPGWRAVPLPDCLAGRISSISADDDELVAIDADRRVFVMDNALKGPDRFNWSRRWGLPFWQGSGRTLPTGVIAWSWSVLSPAEDGTWTDDAGNAHEVGNDKVSHIWALRDGGRRMTFMDPWLASDDSYEMCGPVRSRFRAVNLSTSGSTVFVIGRHGDLYTRLFDFDLSGSDGAFFDYSYEPQKRGAAKAPIHRTLRVEGLDARGRTGYWEKDIIKTTSAAWRFHRTGEPLRGTRLDNPRRDTTRLGLGAPTGVRFAGTAGALKLSVEGYDVHCTPSTLRVSAGGKSVDLVLHSVDGLRGAITSPRLDATPRSQYGDVEVPASVLAHLDRQPAAIRAFVGTTLKRKRFTDVSLTVTRSALAVEELGWTLRR